MFATFEMAYNLRSANWPKSILIVLMSCQSSSTLLQTVTEKGRAKKALAIGHRRECIILPTVIYAECEDWCDCSQKIPSIVQSVTTLSSLSFWNLAVPKTKLLPWCQTTRSFAAMKPTSTEPLKTPYAPSDRSIDLRWYFVCIGCNAKWFCPLATVKCPRCHATCKSTEQITPPWKGPISSNASNVTHLSFQSPDNVK